MKQFVYFVSYAGRNVEVGQFWGNMEISIESLITSFEHIREIEQHLAEKYGYSAIAILNFQLLREENV